MTSQMCSVRLRPGEVSGQDIKRNSASCSWNHYNAIRVLWQEVFSCWNIPFPLGKTDAIYGCYWSAIKYRYSAAFMVCSTTTMGPRDVQENVHQSITGLCMTCCTLREQPFAWNTAYPDMAIGGMNDKLSFVWPRNSLQLFHDPVAMFPDPA